MIVADTKLIAYLLLEGEHTAVAEQVLERDGQWIAPLLWRSELRNVLALHVRQGLLPLDQALSFMELSEILMGGREYALASDPILRLAEHSRCAAYDCEFVVLAQQRDVPLVTFDRGVLDAFPGIAVDPRRFVA